MSPRSTTTTTGLSSFSGGRNDERTVLGSSAANCHIASTAGADTWKTWAGRKHGSDDSFEVLDLFRGMKRSLHNRFFVSPPPPGTVCPICFTEPNDNASEWHITWCNHAVCLDCLRGYASSQIRDRDQMGPLKCPVCPKALRRRDAIVSLAHDEELIRQWDVKLRNQLLRALPSYRHCPKCSDRGDGPGGGGGGGGFVTPQCLAPHYEERRKDATTLLKDGRAAARFLIGCQYLFVVWLIAKTPSRSPTLDLFFMMVPIYIFFKMALGVDGVLARAAREKLRRPITVVCPCCNEDFILPADKKYSEEEETSRWINANTRPCPSCSVPISKNGGCNHMKCFHCRVDFCWACMRLRTNCKAWQCNNGAPFRNAIPARSGGNGDDQAEDSILTVIDHLLDRPYPHLKFYDGMILFGCLVLRNWVPLLDLGGAGQIFSFLFFKSLPFAVTLAVIFGVEWERFRSQTQTQQHNPPGPHMQNLTGHFRPPNNNAQSISRVRQRLEQQMLDQAIARSLVEQ